LKFVGGSVDISTPTTTMAVRILNNANLPTCRAEELKSLFVAAGYDAATMTVSGNPAYAP
jgi:type III secretory pathway lipoprotein EscJ